MKKYELLAATAVALLAATPAFADTAQGKAADQSAATPQAADQAAAADDAGPDIVVTATKREQTLLDTPVAVSVTSGATIEQAAIRDLKDLQSVVPSLRVNQLQSSANTNFIIRGFGNGANNAGIEPSVGVFIDGVYRSRSAAQIADLPDLKRVEVLRGPQSTLFGKNASAGIISIVTAEPAFRFGGTVEASYGNYNAFILKGSVTGPISDTVAFSLAANYNNRDGYAYDALQRKDVNNRNRYGFRGQLLFQPSADFKIRIIGDYDRINENCCVAGNVINGPTGAIVNALAGGVGIDPNLFSYRVYNNFLSSNKIDNYGGSIQADYDFGKLALTSISAYREVKSNTNQDSDFTGADLIGSNAQQLKIGTFTQELRIASKFDGPINFLLGGFYFNEKINQANQITFGRDFRGYGNALIQAGTGGALNVATLETTFGALEGNPAKYAGAFFRQGDGLNERYHLGDDSASVFGQVDFKPLDRLTLTAGFNYTDDSKKFSTNVISSDVFSGINFNAPQYAPFRTALLVGAGLPPASAAFCGSNPTATGCVNPLNALAPLQFLPPFENVPNAIEPAKTHDGNFSYTLRGAYKFNDHVNAYVTYATGFKASSVNLSRDSRPTAADLAALTAAGLAVVNLSSGSRFAGPEKSSVIEGGIKAQWRNVAFNAAIFEQQIKGFQSNVFTGTGFSLVNAPKQSTFGVEFDGTYTPFKALTLNGAVTYLSPKYDSFPVAGAITLPNYTVTAANLSGTRPAGIPDFSVSVGATYTRALSDTVKFLLRTDFDYQTPVQIAESTAPAIIALTREVKELNMAASLQFKNGLELSVWGRNVTDDRYITTIFSSVAQSGSVSAYPNQPATYGGTVRFKF